MTHHDHDRESGADHQRIHFETVDVGTERDFLRAYVLDAAQRLPETAGCEQFVFVRAGDDPGVDGGLVVVDLYGDPAAVIDREREAWDALVADGPLTGWALQDDGLLDKLAEHYGADAVTSHERLRYAASAMSGPAFEVLDERPPAVDVDPDREGAPVGWHRVLHLLSNHQGYSIPEELDAHVENVAMCVEILGQSDGPEAARERAEAISQRLFAVCDELEAREGE